MDSMKNNTDGYLGAKDAIEKVCRVTQEINELTTRKNKIQIESSDYFRDGQRYSLMVRI